MSTVASPAAARVEPYALAARGVGRVFGSVHALDGVDLAVSAGSIHAVLGENGAGKSTLAKIFAGALRASSGAVSIRGSEVELRSPREGIALGVGLVSQHLTLIPEMTISENVLFGFRASSGVLAHRGAVMRELSLVADELDFELPGDVRVSELSLGERQRVEILRLLRREVHTLILDEPTDVLTPGEGEALFAALRRLVDRRGVTVLVITHRLGEVFGAADRVSVLRDGRLRLTEDVASVTERGLLTAMLGREYRPPAVVRESASETVAPTLRVSGATCSGAPGLDAVDLTVRPGEVLGIAGVDGNGQDALAEVLAGSRRIAQGRIVLAGEDVTRFPVVARRRAGLAYVPADRQREGLALDMTVWENLALRDLAPGGTPVGRTAARARAERQVHDFDVRCASIDSPVTSLSGGNQQKLVLARELSGEPVLLVAAQPTRGLDMGARAEVHERLLARACAGCGVVLISSDLDEVLSLSHRVVVLARGRIAGEFEGPEWDLVALGGAMAAAPIAA